MHATASALYLQILFNTVERLGISKAAFIRKNSLKDFAEIGEYVPLSDVLKYWKLAANALNHPGLGFEAGKNMQHSDMGTFVYALMNCATFGEAHDTALTYQPILCSAFNTTRKDISNRIGSATLHYKDLSAEEGRHLSEFDFAQTLNLARFLTGDKNSEVSFHEVRFKHSELYPAHYYEEYFGCPVKFSQSANEVLYEKSILDIKVAGHNKELRSLIMSQLNFQIESEAKKRCNPLSEKVSHYIEDHIGKPLPDASQAASHFAMSISTFRRRLALEDTNYPELLNVIKRSAAENLLVNSENSLEQISFHLDFANSSSFTRAFKRWNGVTPKAYRAKGLSIITEDETC